MRPDPFEGGPATGGTRAPVLAALNLPGIGLALLILSAVAASVAGPQEACRAGEGAGGGDGGDTGPCRALVLPAGPSGVL